MNNAGYGFRDNIVDVDFSEFDRLFDTNVCSVITLLCHILRKTNDIACQWQLLINSQNRPWILGQSVSKLIQLIQHGLGINEENL